MKRIVIIGLILAALGVAGLIIQSVTYRADSTTVDLGPVEVTATQEKTLNIPRVAAQAAIGVGAILVVLGLLARGPDK